MSTVITLTFSPCIDKSMSIPVLLPQKKLRCTALEREPGGGGINVARVLRELGGNVVAVFPSGGYAGKYFNQLIEKEKLPAVIIETVHEIRENIMVFEEATGQQYRFVMPDPELYEKEWKKCLEAVAGIKNAEYIIVSGSLPAGVPLSIYSELSNIASRMNARMIVDTSGVALQQAIRAGVYLIKPNLGELAGLAGRKQVDTGEVEAVAREVIGHYNCEVIVVSLGAEGAVLVTATETHKVKAPEVPIKSTVGAGDSMVAGIIYYLSLGQSLLQSLQYGVACGTAATLNPGTALCKKEDVERLYALIIQGDTAER